MTPLVTDAPAPDRSTGRSAGPAPRTAVRARAGLAVALKYLTLVLASAAVLVPLAATFLTSLRTARELSLDPGALAPPADWLNLHNYAVAFRQGHMVRGLANTAFILAFSLAGTVLIGSMTAYAVDRFPLRFKRTVLALFLVASLVPGVTTQVATFQIVDGLGLIDSRWSAVLLYTGTDIVSIYIFLQFIRSIPVSLDEAARLDGAGTWTIYWRVILPLLRPAIATVVIIRGVFIYNDFYIPFLYLPSDEHGTISTSLFRFKGPFGAQWEVLTAGAVLVIVPSLVAFLFLQRFIYNGFASGTGR